MRIGVIGGGPAGFFGAISAASQMKSAAIEIFEATHQPLGKVLISGGGRCNVTHHCFDPAELGKNYPRGYKELLGPFNRFQASDTVAWFEGHGVKLKTEEDGRMFPVTDESSTIAACLLQETKRLGIKLRLGARVIGLRRVSRDAASPLFEIELANKERLEFERVLLASGSNSRGFRFAQDLGHTIVPPVPSLFTFEVRDRRLEGLAGISFDEVSLSLTTEGKKKLVQKGPMLITHWGLSGPAVLKLSAWGARMLFESNYQGRLTINFFPDKKGGEIYEALVNFREQNIRKKVQGSAPFPIPRRYWARIAEAIGISEAGTWGKMTRAEMTAIARELLSAEFAVAGKGEFKEEFVTCGGVELKEVDFTMMQSKRCPGLYFAGEILDIDGITGGFNFQSAWTTGWIAGLAMVK